MKGFIPFRLTLVVDGHEEAIFLDSSGLVQYLYQVLDELRFVSFRSHRQTIGDDECIKTLFESDVILFFEIWRGDILAGGSLGPV